MIVESNQEKYQLDSNRWISTLPKKKTDNTVRKYSLTIFLFVVGLILVSTIKNETRNLQKKINNLKASINVLNTDLHQATLDHEVITSPENISQLAKEYLEYDLVFYEKSQIKQLNEKAKTLTRLGKTEHKKTFKKENNEIIEETNISIAKRIEATKTGLKKLQEFYSKPEKLPGEIKLLLVKNIESKKNKLKRLYSEPNDTIKLGKVQRWAGLQVVKAILGMPIVPGR